MVRALSSHAKKLEHFDEKNKLIAKATDALKAELLKPKGEKKKSARTIAAEFGIPSSFRTIDNHAKGIHEPMSSYLEDKQKLHPAEERALVDVLLRSAERGFPLQDYQAVHMANKVLKHRLADTFDSDNPEHRVGRHWIVAFKNRHMKELQTHWCRPLDEQRAQSLNPSSVQSWFELVKSHIVDRGILPEDIYGMDETGCPASNHGKRRGLGARGAKVVHHQGSASRENVTAIVTICADGTLPVVPSIIFKGKNVYSSWLKKNPANAFITATETGWSNGGIALSWLKQVFEPATREKANGRTRVLLIDGHTSHYTPELLESARKHNIDLLGYPPHCTHALQGLDVVCFAKFKAIWHDAIYEYEIEHGRALAKDDYAGVWGDAYLKAFVPNTVKAAFSATGVHPFNPSVIQPSQMAPSEVTSTHATPLIPPSTPVKRIVTAFHNRPPTAFELDPETHRPAGEDTEDLDEPLSPPSTPTRAVHTRHRSLSLGPNDTPSKRLRIFYGSFTRSASASHLISTAYPVSAQRLPHPQRILEPELPEPDWSLISPSKDLTPDNEIAQLRQSLGQAHSLIKARTETNVYQNAALVLQHLELDKMNTSLHEAQNKPKAKGFRVHTDGKGILLNSEGMIAKQRESEEKRADKEVAKAQRVEQRAEKKRKKEELDARWKESLKRYDEELADWERQIKGCKEDGVPPRHWPNKPKRPKKSNLVANASAGTASDGEGGNGLGDGDGGNSSSNEKDDSDALDE